jgi:recombination protein RecA
MTAAAARTGCCLLLLNQVRHRAAEAMGDPETTAGGHALHLHSAARLEIIPLARFAQNGEIAGLRVRVRAVKNRLAVPFREAEFDIHYAGGIARDEDLAACAARCGIAAPMLSLDRHPDARAALDRAVRRALDLPVSP